MIFFDQSLGKIDPGNEDEILLYHLIACMYICLKIESGFCGMQFKHFLNLCAQLPTYDLLQRHLAPHLETCIWTIELFPILELEILNSALKFKMRFVSSAELVHTIVKLASTAGKRLDSRAVDAIEPNAYDFEMLI